jgi:undecaprenyl-diphosphatase
MSTLAQAALLGVLQGLTEFLPVSSTAHLLVAGRLIGYRDPGGVFTVMIQFGSILAVAWLYRYRIGRVARGLLSEGDERRFAVMIAAAFLPFAAVAALVGPFIRTVLYERLDVIAAAFIVGGVVMLVLERRRAEPVVFDADRVPVGRAFGVGICQMLALVPGVSRSGATIIGGMLMGLDRRAAAEFSFFLAMPTMAAAFAKDLLDLRHLLTAGRAAEIGVGFVMAFVASWVVVQPFLNYVGRSGFAPFAWYRILIGVVLLLVVSSGWL